MGLLGTADGHKGAPKMEASQVNAARFEAFK